MKILMFGWEFPPHNSGGLGVACFGMTKALAERNMEIAFVLPKKLPIENDFLNILFADTDDPRISLRIVDSPILPYKYGETDIMGNKNPAQYVSKNSLQEEVLKYGLAAREIAKTENFDVIHAHDWLSMCAGVEAKKVSGKPLVVHVHATEFDRTGGEHANPFVYDIEKSGLDAADKVVTVSEYTKEIVSKKYGTPLEKIEVVHNGNSYEEYSVNSEKLQLLENIKKGGDKLVLFLGRITLQKGPDWFLKTAKKVLDIMPNVTFIVTGSGDMEEQMVSEAGDLGISDKIIFTGFLRGEETDAIFRAADLYVMPSVSEPFGLVALESASRGTPVLISKQSGVSEVLKHSLKADFWDTDEMTDKIIAVLENKPLLEDLQKNGRIEASGVTWDKAAEKLVNLYYSLIHKHA